MKTLLTAVAIASVTSITLGCKTTSRSDTLAAGEELNVRETKSVSSFMEEVYRIAAKWQTIEGTGLPTGDRRDYVARLDQNPNVTSKKLAAIYREVAAQLKEEEIKTSGVKVALVQKVESYSKERANRFSPRNVIIDDWLPFVNYINRHMRSDSKSAAMEDLEQVAQAFDRLTVTFENATVHSFADEVYEIAAKWPSIAGTGLRAEDRREFVARLDQTPYVATRELAAIYRSVAAELKAGKIEANAIDKVLIERVQAYGVKSRNRFDPEDDSFNGIIQDWLPFVKYINQRMQMDNQEAAISSLEQVAAAYDRLAIAFENPVLR